MAGAASKKRKRAIRRRELIAGIVVLGAVLLALIGVAVALFSGQSPQAISKPKLQPLPTLQEQMPNPYPKADYLYDGQRMTLADGQGIPGIDVSRYQGKIDWQKVADSGVKFVFIRIGYRTYGSGEITADTYAQANYRGAKAAGLKVGVYFFSQAITEEEAAEEAEYVLRLIEGKQIDMPVVYDWEYIDPATADGIPRTVAMSKRLLTECTKAFCETVKAAGYEPMIYFNADQSHKKMYLEELTDYPFWLASYTTELDYPYKIDMWQYTATGTVPGIEGTVDINLYLKYN